MIIRTRILRLGKRKCEASADLPFQRYTRVDPRGDERTGGGLEWPRPPAGSSVIASRPLPWVSFLDTPSSGAVSDHG